MDPQLKKLITTGVLLLLFFVLGGIYFFMPKGGGTPDLTAAPTSTVTTAPPPAPSAALTFQIKNDHTITFIWKYLPEGTEYVNVYRALKGTQNWAFWKKIRVPIGSRNSGEIDIALGLKDHAGDYDYYGEAVDNHDEPIWRSPGTPPVPPNPQTSSTPPLPPGTTPPPSSSTSTPSSTPPQSTSTTQNPTPTSTTQSTSSPQTPTSPCPPGVPCYYTPELSLSGTSTPISATFWVQHIDDDIEIGWQNLATTTTKVIVSRSVSQTGPWTSLLIQQNPVRTNYYRVRFSDETLYAPYFYMLDLYEGNTKTLSVGPLPLPALIQ